MGNLEDRVAAFRRFNRFYTAQIGLLEEGLLKSRFSLSEARVLYELANRRGPTAAELARDLGIDAGYLSRILKAFEERGLLQRVPSERDGRQSHLWLSEEGRTAFAPLNEGAEREVANLLSSMPEPTQERLLGAMRTIEELFNPHPDKQLLWVLRPHRPGDMGWVIHRHGALYAQEYGWDGTFEVLVAEIVTKFVRSFDPLRERCWIAERDGVIAGSAFLVRDEDEVAKLRLLLVEPWARGTGLGKRLVAECERFARQAGYRRIVLWTNDVLYAARHIYERAGYRLVHTEPHTSFGHELVGENWELDLQGPQ